MGGSERGGRKERGGACNGPANRLTNVYLVFRYPKKQSHYLFSKAYVLFWSVAGPWALYLARPFSVIFLFDTDYLPGRTLRTAAGREYLFCSGTDYPDVVRSPPLCRRVGQEPCPLQY